MWIDRLRSLFLVSAEGRLAECIEDAVFAECGWALVGRLRCATTCCCRRLCRCVNTASVISQRPMDEGRVVPLCVDGHPSSTQSGLAMRGMAPTHVIAMPIGFIVK